MCALPIWCASWSPGWNSGGSTKARSDHARWSFGGNMCADCSRVVVFTGPSLHPRAAAALLNATILPPIKRGDLEPFLASKPAAVGIIDGEFYQSLAVSPKEVRSEEHTS